MHIPGSDATGSMLSTCRFRGLQQRLLGKAASATAPLLDAILVIAGPDGKENHGSHITLKYLIGGVSGRDLANPVLCSDLEALDEVVAVITMDKIALLYPARARHVLEDALVWPGICEYALPAEDEEDNEAFEEHKIELFKKMIADILPKKGSVVGVTLQRGFTETAEGVERWPLIQAFALELEGRTQSGFFTQQYQVCDISEDLCTAMGCVDPMLVSMGLRFAAPSLDHHFGEVRDAIGHHQSAAGRARLSEEDMVSSLALVSEFGHLDDGHGRDFVPSRHEKVPPRVLLGRRCRLITQPCDSYEPSTGTSPTPGSHMIVEGSEPSLGLACCRTWFLATGDDAIDPLIRAYSFLSSEISSAVALSAECTDTESLSKAVESAIRSCPGFHPFSTWVLNVFLDCFDAFQSVGRPPLRSPGCFAYVRLSMDCKDWGSVAVGDTFSLIPSLHERAGVMSWCLTSRVCNEMVTWGGVGAEESHANFAEAQLRDSVAASEELGLGSRVDAPAGPNTTEMLFPRRCKLCPRLSGALHLFSSGFAVTGLHGAPILVSFPRHVLACTLSTSTDNGALLVILDISAGPLDHRLPFFSRYEASRIILMLPIWSPTAQAVIDLMPQWKDGRRLEGNCNEQDLRDIQAGITHSRHSDATDAERRAVVHVLGRRLAPVCLNVDGPMAVVMLGLPGSGVLCAAMTVLRLASHGLDVAIVPPSKLSSIGVTLSRAARRARKILVVVAGVISDEEVLASLWACGIPVACLTACIGSCRAFEPSIPGVQQWAHGVLDHCRVANNVLLLSQCGRWPAHKEEELRKKLYRMNVGATLLMGASDHLNLEVVECIVHGAAAGAPCDLLTRSSPGDCASIMGGTYDLAALQACLATLFKGAKVSARGVSEKSHWLSRPSPGHLTGIRRALELAAWKVEEKSRRADFADAAARNITEWDEAWFGKILCTALAGCVRLADGTAIVIDAEATSICLSPVPSSALADDETSWVQVYGRPSTALVSVLNFAKTCSSSSPPRRALRTRSDITEREVKSLGASADAIPLPEGWVFDGRWYLDIHGRRLEKRPDMDSLIDSYIKKQNASIRGWNEAQTIFPM